ncbi:hypothetical protein NHQ30_001300 [Ciborinia camelliae]|nr:hypothetical protein NHQ30_001300 [Ciborinia camelliae]
MSSFPQFGQLPPELQLKIWSHFLEPLDIIPRIIKVDYDSNTSSYKYKSQPPLLTQTCRGSRKIALENYSVLNPSAVLTGSGAIYIYPSIDILHYNSSYEPSTHEIASSLASTPFLDPQLPTHLIQHIMLTESYMTLRARHSFLQPISELKNFANLLTIYISLPSHAELERTSQAWYRELMRFSSFPDSSSAPPLPAHITESYAREKVEEEASGRRDVAPGYLLLSREKKFLREHQVLRSFGWLQGGLENAWVFGDVKEGRSGSRVGGEEECLQGRLPVVRYLRELEGE